MTAAQRVAGIGMDRARSPAARRRDRPRGRHRGALRDDAGRRRSGPARRSTSTWASETCMLHGWQSPRPMRTGDLVVIDLTPVVDGYCANLARTFVARRAGRASALAARCLRGADPGGRATRCARVRRWPSSTLRGRGAARARPGRVPRERDRARPRPPLRGDARLDDHPAPPQRSAAGGHDRDDRPPDPRDPRVRRRAPRGRLPGDARMAARSSSRTRSPRSSGPEATGQRAKRPDPRRRRPPTNAPELARARGGRATTSGARIGPVCVP